MKISIVMAAYNGEKYIREQMESIRLQSRTPEEVLIIDDRSTDRTVETVRGFIEEHGLQDTWRIEQNEENRGWRRNFYEGFFRVSGDLIFPCDQDDIWRADKLAVMERLMRADPGINVLASGYEEFYEDGRTRICPGPEDGRVVRQEPDGRLFRTPAPGCTYCLRASFLERTRPFWQEDFPHDAFLWRLALFTDSYCCLGMPLIRWRKHRSSAYSRESFESKTLTGKREWIGYARASLDAVRGFMEAEGRSSKQKRRLLARADRWLLTRARFYDRKSPADGLRLAGFLGCYSRFRQWPGDWYLVYVKRK